MSEEMYHDNYHSIVNTDYSEVIIDLMRKRCDKLDKMSWEVMDINDLRYKPGSFECILEKGTLDALLVGEKSPWSLSEENTIKMDRILERVICSFSLTLYLLEYFSIVQERKMVNE